MSGKPRWWPLLVTNFRVFNDNYLKTLACFIAVSWVGTEYEARLFHWPPVHWWSLMSSFLPLPEGGLWFSINFR